MLRLSRDKAEGLERQLVKAKDKVADLGDAKQASFLLFLSLFVGFFLSSYWYPQNWENSRSFR